MSQFDTRQSLLIKIRDSGDQVAWGEFVDLYTPLIFRFCGSRGVADTDRPDVMQEIFKAISNSIGRFDYDQNRSSFRNWLFTVCRSKINNYLRVQYTRPKASGTTSVRRRIENEPDPREEQDWETDYRRYMFQWAAKKVRHEFATKTWSAFWRTAVEGEEVADVASDLDMSSGAVWVAKSRVVARIRQRIEAVVGTCDPDLDVV